MRRVLAFALLLLATGAHAEDPDVLWKIVGGKCLPEAKAGETPMPCAAVDLARGMAVLKDREGVAQYLVIPTTKITGIEDPAALTDTTGFAVAWETRALVERKLGHALPRDAISLAVNSRTGRSQNQLHIHVDCLDATVRATLRATGVPETWTQFPSPLAGHTYQARFVAGETLAAIEPFRLLADKVAGPIGDWTLVVVGATGPAAQPGFVLLAQNDNFASGEQLQDHACQGY